MFELGRSDSLHGTWSSSGGSENSTERELLWSRIKSQNSKFCSFAAVCWIYQLNHVRRNATRSRERDKDEIPEWKGSEREREKQIKFEKRTWKQTMELSFGCFRFDSIQVVDPRRKLVQCFWNSFQFFQLLSFFFAMMNFEISFRFFEVICEDFDWYRSIQ